MDISVIKKNKFWIIIGGTIIITVVLYFVFTKSYKAENTRKMKSIENTLSRLERYRRKGLNIINSKWIEEEKKKLEIINEKQLKYNELLSERDSHIEKFFSTDSGEKIEDEALWKNEYIRSVNLINNDLAESNISLSGNALPFTGWGDEIPSWDEIVKAQKRFWIIEEWVNILQKEELKIESINAIDFKDAGLTTDEKSNELYDRIHFTFKVSMDMERILFLISELLKSKILIEIVTVDISRKAGSVVDVVINAYVIDFKQERDAA